jgi:hypothetical protein
MIPYIQINPVINEWLLVTEDSSEIFRSIYDLVRSFGKEKFT